MRATLLLAVAGAAVLTACSGSSAPAQSTQPVPTTVPLPGVTATSDAAPTGTTTSAAPTGTTTAPASASASASARPSAARTGPGGLLNLVVTDDVRKALVVAYVQADKYQPAWITGTRAGSVFYAEDPASGTQYAQASFEASRTAPQIVLVDMQDAGVNTNFRKPKGGSWAAFDICSAPAFLTFVGGRLPADGHC